MCTSSLDDESVIRAIAAEDWEFIDSDTKKFTHGIHRYSGKFIPQIAARAIEILTSKDEIILDPYCGSGTTNLESALLKRRSIGIDLNPLATLIAKVKTTQVEEKQFNEVLSHIRTRILSREQAMTSQVPLFQDNSEHVHFDHCSNGKWQDEWFQKWFNEDILSDLLFLEDLIQDVKLENIQNILKVCFSEILRKSSNAASGYPNIMFDKSLPKRPRPLKPFLRTLKKIEDMVNDLTGTPINDYKPIIITANSTCLPLANNSIDAIVTHPPYIGSIPYAEYGLLSLKWLGYDPKVLDNTLTGGRRQSKDVVERFSSDYCIFMHECYRTLRPGRIAFFMVGNPIVRREIIDLKSITVDFAIQAGFTEVASTKRVGINRRANKMGNEFLLFFRKPS